MTWLELPLWGGTVRDWTVALAVALGLMLIFALLRRVVVARLRARAQTTETQIDNFLVDVLEATRAAALLVVALWAGAQWLALPARPAGVLTNIAIVAVLVQVALWGNRAVLWWIGHTLRSRRDADAAGATTMSVLGFVARVALWSLALLMILDNLGVDITALVASVGIGGIAVALAVQNILGDIFASLSIALDKPFVIGDFIIVGDTLGTVEYIGLKTTRIRSLSGEQVVFSNTDLLGSRIRNFKRMFERRVVFGFGVVYRTEAEQLERIPAIVRELVEAQPRARFDRAHFKSFGDSSLDFEVVYFVSVPDFNVYMDIQQAINLGLFRRFASEGIEFAYPTRTLHLVPAAAGTT
jgi:small-conductance mechanosensitive channel